MVDLLSYRAKEENMAFIYKIVNDINDKVYVGKTTLPSIEERFKEHCKDYTRARKEKRPLYDAMQKYGKEHFQIILLEECSGDILNDREKYWIEYYNSYEFGYNATCGGDGVILYDYRKLTEIYLELKNLSKAAQVAQCDVKTMRKALKEYNIPILSDSEVKILQHQQDSLKIQCVDIKNFNNIIEFENQYLAAEWIKKQGKSTQDERHIRYAIIRAAKGKDNRTQAFGYKWSLIE